MARKSGKKTKSSAKTKKKNRSWFGFAFKWLFVLGLWAGLFVVGICAYYATELPDITQNASFERKSTITVKAADGAIIARYGDIVGNKVTINDIPKNLVNAVLATEDRRFYYHFGLDPLGLARAIYVNIRDDGVKQGGSTITQQLAKNLFLSKEKTYKRKIQEAMLAIWLEYELTKDEILSAYLNRVYLGAGTYGVDAASKVYFKKPVGEIDLQEAAMLAGLLKAPSRYSPLSNPTLAKQRAQTVINAMVDAGYLDEADKNALHNATPKPTRKPTGDYQRYYSDWIVDQLEDLIGTPNEDLIIETVMNPDIQQTAQEALEKTIRENGENKHITQGAVVVMRPNGAVVALVGGKDYALSQFNRASQARRQPGSSFKPFVYLTALERGWSPYTLIEDAPITTGRYRPKNFGNQYYGEVTLLEALTYSLNTIAYQLIKAVGPGAVIDTVQRLGIKADLQPDLSLALGTNELTPLELTGAYAGIANGGVAVQPYGITKIESEGGTLYYTHKDENKTKAAVNPNAVTELTTMMQSVIENGTGRGAAFGAQAAGKTGTSQDSRDAWFAGFTSRLVTVVWLGNDDNTPMKHVTGGSYPARIWRDIMAKSNGAYAPIKYKTGVFRDIQALLGFWGSPQDNESDDIDIEVIRESHRRHHNENPADRERTPLQLQKNKTSIYESRRYND
ncbi:MAG: transglycosylase domain-containing protein [Bdellovibrionales bacterium]